MEKLKVFLIEHPSILTVGVLSMVFPFNLGTLFSIKFWICEAMLVTALVLAEHRGARRYKEGKF